MAENKDNHYHNHHECKSDSGLGVRQTLDEMDFERGIWHAAQSNDLKRVKQLLIKGTSASEEDSAGYTALHYASRAGHLEMCKLLLDNGADVNSLTRCGRATAVHRAAMQGNKDIVELLLKYRANCNIQDADGYTALHRAVLANSQAVWDLLVEKTSNELIDNSGNTAEQLVRVKNSNIVAN